MLLLLLRDTTKEWIISSLAKEVDMTYVHTLNILNHYYNLGIVEFENRGRRKIVKLTNKGVKVAGLLNEILEALKSEEELN